VLFLSKLLPLAVMPLGIALLAGVFGFLLIALRFRRTGLWLIAAGLVVLWVGATPVAARLLAGRVEAAYPPAAAEDSPSADVIILLAGLLEQPVPPRAAPDFNSAADRAVHAARLFRAGRAPAVLIAGDAAPFRASVVSEAALLADVLAEWGVPRERIRLEEESLNTAESAANVAALWPETGWRSALLVTSALHMPRAMEEFRGAGLPVTAAPADIASAGPLVQSWLDFLPQASALALTSEAMREIIGGAAARLR
jgi:uncharacterized SAM-binding protein YcdF (DUF218 family)